MSHDLPDRPEYCGPEEPPWVGDPRYDPDALMADRLDAGYYDDLMDEEYPRG